MGQSKHMFSTFGQFERTKTNIVLFFIIMNASCKGISVELKEQLQLCKRCQK